MKKGIALITLAACGLGILTTDAMAGNRAGAFTITPGVGYYYFDDKRNVDNTGLANLSLGYDFDYHWGIEALFGPFHTHLTNYPPGAAKNVQGDLYLIDGIYRFNPYWQPVEPYLSAGIGAVYLSRAGNDANTKANVNVGLGAQWFFSDSIALRGEVRDLYTFSGGDNDAMVNFGVSFLIGGNKPVEQVVYKDAPMKDDNS